MVLVLTKNARRHDLSGTASPDGLQKGQGWLISGVYGYGKYASPSASPIGTWSPRDGVGHSGPMP